MQKRKENSISRKDIREAIQSHDRIVFIGHGTELGFSWNLGLVNGLFATLVFYVFTFLFMFLLIFISKED